MSIVSHGQASPVTSEMPYLTERLAQRTIGGPRGSRTGIHGFPSPHPVHGVALSPP